MDGPLEPDDDLLSLPGVCYQVAAATVSGIIDAYVPRDDEKPGREHQEILAAPRGEALAGGSDGA